MATVAAAAETPLGVKRALRRNGTGYGKTAMRTIHVKTGIRGCSQHRLMVHKASHSIMTVNNTHPSLRLMFTSSACFSEAEREAGKHAAA